MSIPDPELAAAVGARDIGAVVDRLGQRFAIPNGHDEWVLDTLMEGVPADVDDESRAAIREQLRDRLGELVPPGVGEAS